MRATVARRIGSHSQIQTGDLTAILADVHRELATDYEWSFRKRETLLSTVAPYTAGTVSATQGSATVVGTGTAWVTGMVGRSVRISGDNAFFSIRNVQDATHLTLGDSQGAVIPWAAPSVSNAGYSIFQHQYAIPADVAIILQNVREWPLVEHTIADFNAKDPMRLSVGAPSQFALARANIVDSRAGTATVSAIEPIGTGETEHTVPVTAVTNTFVVTLTPSWNTTAWVVARTVTGFTVRFQTPAPAGATLLWSRLETGAFAGSLSQGDTTAISTGAVSAAIPVTASDTFYHVAVVPTWNTTVSVPASSKLTTGFTVVFGTPAPAGAAVFWTILPSGTVTVNVPQGATASITPGVSSAVIPVSMANASYRVALAPSWNTTVWVPVATKLATNFTVFFGAPAPSVATVDWETFETPTVGVTEFRYVELWPVPAVAQAYRMPYLIEPPDLISDNQLPVCPSEPIEWRASAEAAWFLYSKTGDARWDALGRSYYRVYAGDPETGELGVLYHALRDDEQRFGLPKTFGNQLWEISQSELARRDWDAL